MNQDKRNESLERAIENYSNLLYKICFVILKNEQDTKDVLQETFLTYMTKRPRFNSEKLGLSKYLKTNVKSSYDSIKSMPQSLFRRWKKASESQKARITKT